MKPEVFVWALVGGLFVSMLSYGAVYYQNKVPSNKQLSRDFIIGAVFTGFLYPLIPESFDDIREVLHTTAESLQPSSSGFSLDPGVQVGPANF